TARRERPEAPPLRPRPPPGALELELLELELAGLCVGDLRDREILDCEAGRVEEGDVARAPPSLRLADEQLAELGDVRARDCSGRDRRGELATVAGLLPVVAAQVSPAEFL